MKAIATYFAEIGFKVNQKDITEVNKTFSEMRKKFVDLNRSMRSGSGVEIKARISPHSFTQIERQIKSFERRMKPLDIRLKNLQMNKSGRGLNRSVAPSVDPKFEAAFSDSFKKMSDTLTQIRKLNEDSNKELKRLSSLTNSVNRRGGGIGGTPSRGGIFGWGGLDSSRTRTDYGRRSAWGVTQSSTTNNSSGVGTSGLSRRSSSPFHNPLMMGGFTGSLTRYGLHALPLFGGVIGFNSLSQAAIGAEKQKTSLDYAASISGTGLNGDQYREFLDKLGYDIGMSTDKLVDSFTYMLTNVAGSKAQTQLERGFSSLTKLSTILGHTQQQQDASLKAFTKMLTDPKATAAQLKGTPTDNIPHIMTLAAEALAGGDMNKLIEKLGNKEVVPDRDFPLIYEQIDKTIQPYMAEYFDSIRFSKNETQRLKDRWMAEFLEGGGAEAAQGIYDTLNYIMGDGKGGAEVVGNFTNATSDLVQAALLVPKEVMDYFEGMPKPENFMEHIFGKRQAGDFLDSITESTKIRDAFLENISSPLTMIGNYLKSRHDIDMKEAAVGAIGATGTFVVRGSQNVVSALGDITGGTGLDKRTHTQARHLAEDLAREEFPDWKEKSLQDQKDILEIITPHLARAISNGFNPDNPEGKGFFGQAFSSPSQNRKDRIAAAKEVLAGSLPDPQARFLFKDDRYIDKHGSRSKIKPVGNIGEGITIPDGFSPVTPAPYPFDMSRVPQEYLETAQETLDSLLESLMSTPRPVNNTINQELNISLNMENTDVLSAEEVVDQIKAASAEAINEALVATSSMYISGMA